MRIISLGFIVATLLASCLKTVQFGYNLSFSFGGGAAARGKSSLLDAMYFFPGVAWDFRSLLVFSAFYLKRNDCRRLVEEVHQLFLFCYPEEKEIKKLTSKLKSSSIKLLLMTIFVSWMRCALLWADLFTDASKNITLWSEVNTQPVTMHVSNWGYVFVEFFCRYVPFPLSQQVQIVAVMLGVVLSGIIGKILQEITLATNNIQTQTNSKTLNLSLLAETLNKWSKIHVKLMLLINELNDYFGVILLTTYLLDVSCVLGSASWLIAGNENTPAIHYAASLFNALSLGGMATLFCVPFVVVQEKVTSDAIFDIYSAKMF